MAWTDQDIEYLKSKWGKVSAPTIARNLGKTKGSIIGKAHRLNLPKLRLGPLGTKERLLRTKERNGTIVRKAKLKPVLRPLPKPQIDDNFVPIGITFRKIEGDQCRYILGDTNGLETLFCGHSTVDQDTSWCPHHAAVCTQPRQPGRSAGVPTGRR